MKINKTFRTPITYYGGKQKLADKIISMMPVHNIYCEPFFGGGSVFFRKCPSKVEVINDKDSRIITFYNQVIDNFENLQQLVKRTLCSESEWLKARRIFYNQNKNYLETITDLDIAWSVWVLCNMSYAASPNTGWKWDNKGIVTSMLNNKKRDFTEKIKERLSNVQISCRDAIAVIEQRDTSQTFFYLDPPYVNSNQQHYSGYSEADLDILLTTLSMLKGKFILSHFENKMINEAIEKFRWKVCKNESAMVVSGNCQQSKRRKTEILVSNYETEITLFQ